ncbi:MAG: riboflavin biosynthesis protein RibF [Candidatus Acetothermia bacterium]
MTNKDCERVLTVGNFDGVHRGHCRLLNKVSDIASRTGAKSLAYTFSPSLAHNKNGTARSLIIPPQERINLLRGYVDEVHVADFEDIKDLSPAQFVKSVLIEELNCCHVVVGEDWRFGKGGQGTPDHLRALAGSLFEVHVMPPVLDNGRPISSTRVRKAIQKGKIKLVAKLLGRPPALHGEVVRGRGVGKILEFPTANLTVDSRIILPKNGVYAAVTRLENQSIPSALYIGDRPTFSGEDPVVEVHLLGGRSWDLYDRELTVHLKKYVREDRKFDDPSELKAAIERDICEIKAELGVSVAEGAEVQGVDGN